MADRSGWPDLLARTYEVIREPVDRLDAAVDRRTPCSEWTAGDLFEHVVSAIDMFATAAGAPPAEAAGGTPVERFDAAVVRNLAAWRSQTDPEKTVTLAFGQFPAATAAAVNQLDSLVHGWDLASALGLAASLPHDLVQAALRTAEVRFRTRPRGEAFGPELPARDDTAQERLLALTGRDTSAWAAAVR